MQTHTHATDDAGFSLVEVLVAFAVVSIITTVVIFTFNSSKAKAETIIDFSNEVYSTLLIGPDIEGVCEQELEQFV